MRKMVASVCTLLVIAFGLHGHAQNANTTPAGPTIPPLKDVNPEILKLVIDDQWDRGNDMFGKGQVIPFSKIDGKAVAAHDEVRHKTVRELLAAGKMTTARDFSFAALIFQHSGDPSDLMLAHLLASTAVAKGGADQWMMAATLDRYLHSIHEPQIFGTQFFTTDGGHTWTMEPYNRSTLTDAERALWCVIPLAQQQTALVNMQKGSGPTTTSLPDCK